jgi:hypothetical protein
MVPMALVATAGSALVTGMVTDGWEGMRAKVAEWFGRGRKRRLTRHWSGLTGRGRC